jgi:autotransporter adhesin
MSRIVSRARAALPRISRHVAVLSNAVTSPHRHRMALLTGCALAAAIGLSTISPARAGCNSGNDAQTNLLGSAACQADASGSAATAVGFAAKALINRGSAFGKSAFALGDAATAIGFEAGPRVAVFGATNVGANSGTDGAGSYSTAVGGGTGSPTASRASGAYSVAIGGGDGAVFTPSVGPSINLNGAQATGFIGTAVGTASQASGGGSSAFGLGSKATGADSAAYGDFSTASGASSVAIGLFSKATGVSSLAFGRKAIASMSGSVAIGVNSIANVANTVSVGRAGAARRIVNVAAGTQPTDAVNLAQLQARFPIAAQPVASAGTTNAELVDGIRRELAELRSLVKQQQERIAELERRNVAAAPVLAH